jgi:dienelactone hydrolase
VERAKMSAPIARGHVRYWLQKGFAVVAPIRPGYGATGGGDREISGAQFDALGNCTSDPDYRHAADAAVAVTLSAIEWVRTQDWARPAALVLEGQSMGGLTTVATAATNPEGVIAYINFAGGVGGSPERAPGKSCGPERMREAMEAFGKTTKVPNLWLYAENDLYWGAEAPKAWHAAFAAGGSPTTFVQTTAVPAADGHQLLLRGGRLWSVHTDAFIKRLGF